MEKIKEYIDFAEVTKFGVKVEGVSFTNRKV